MLVNPFSGPSIRYISEPMMITVAMTTSRNTMILYLLCLSDTINTSEAFIKRVSLSILKTRSILKILMMIR